jgi:hypothetical protein
LKGLFELSGWQAGRLAAGRYLHFPSFMVDAKKMQKKRKNGRKNGGGGF